MDSWDAFKIAVTTGTTVLGAYIGISHSKPENTTQGAVIGGATGLALGGAVAVLLTVGAAAGEVALNPNAKLP